MNTFKQLAIDFAVVCGIPALLVLGYYFFVGPEASTLLLSSDSQEIVSAPDGSTLGSRSQTLLGQLTALHFDTSIFQDPTFWALTDFTQPVATATLGRTYPFTPSEEVRALVEQSRKTLTTPASAPKQSTSTPLKSTKSTKTTR